MNNAPFNYGPEQEDMKEIDLKRYYTLIKKRFWILLLITVISTLGGYFYSTNDHTPVYETSTRMILGPENEDMNTLMVMIKDPIVMEGVSEQLQLEKSIDTLANQITVSQVEESQVVQISVTDSDPEMAANIANATAVTYKTEMKNILEFNEVQLLSEAKSSTAPIKQASNNITLIALIAGVIVGLGFIFLLDSLDGRIRKERDVEAILGVPVLGTVSNMNKRKFAVKKKASNINAKAISGEKVGVKQNA